MSARFWCLASVHHVVVVVAMVWLVRSRARRESLGASGTKALAELVGMLVVLGVVATGSSWIASRELSDQSFAFVRLLAQVAFGEAPLALAWSAWTLRKAGFGRLALVPGIAAVGLLAVYVDAYHVEPFRLVVERHQVPVRGLQAPFQIVHLSDIQAWKAGQSERRALRQAMREAPDLIVLTGDYLQSRNTDSTDSDIEALRTLFREEGVTARLGVFAVWGNCDRDSRHLFDGLPVHVLENEVARVALPGGDTLAIVGLEWRTSMSPGSRELARLFRKVRPGDHCIVLGHAPDYGEEVARSFDVDLMFAGHTHGGQVALPFFGPPITLSRAPRMVAAGGLTEVNGVPMNVSRGTGMERGSAPQLRFLCPPELSVLELTSGTKRAARESSKGLLE